MTTVEVSAVEVSAVEVSAVAEASERASRTIIDREMPSVLESVSCARDVVVCSVPAPFRRNVSPVVVELVANAVKHGSGPVGLRVDLDGDRLLIAVSDAGSTVCAEVEASLRS